MSVPPKPKRPKPKVAKRPLTATPENYAKCHLIRAINGLLDNLGFSSVSTVVQHKLANVMRMRIMQDVKTAKMFTECTGRTQAVVEDVIAGFKYNKISLTEISEYMDVVGAISEPQPVAPMFPAKRPEINETNHFTWMYGPPPSQKELDERPEHIPPHMPSIYNDWSTVHEDFLAVLRPPQSKKFEEMKIPDFSNMTLEQMGLRRKDEEEEEEPTSSSAFNKTQDISAVTGITSSANLISAKYENEERLKNKSSSSQALLADNLPPRSPSALSEEPSSSKIEKSYSRLTTPIPRSYTSSPVPSSSSFSSPAKIPSAKIKKDKPIKIKPDKGPPKPKGRPPKNPENKVKEKKKTKLDSVFLNEQEAMLQKFKEDKLRKDREEEIRKKAEEELSNYIKDVMSSPVVQEPAPESPAQSLSSLKLVIREPMSDSPRVFFSPPKDSEPILYDDVPAVGAEVAIGGSSEDEPEPVSAYPYSPHRETTFDLEESVATTSSYQLEEEVSEKKKKKDKHASPTRHHKKHKKEKHRDKEKEREHKKKKKKKRENDEEERSEATSSAHQPPSVPAQQTLPPPEEEEPRKITLKIRFGDLMNEKKASSRPETPNLKFKFKNGTPTETTPVKTPSKSKDNSFEERHTKDEDVPSSSVDRREKKEKKKKKHKDKDKEREKDRERDKEKEREREKRKEAERVEKAKEAERLAREEQEKQKKLEEEERVRKEEEKRRQEKAQHKKEKEARKEEKRRKEREREEREREKAKEKDREKEREAERAKAREKEKEKEREREREKERERAREKEKLKLKLLAPADPVTSSSEGQTVDDSTESEDEEVWICPACSIAYTEGANMVCCDNCDEWFHWHCVGLSLEPAANTKWYCPKCTNRLKGKRHNTGSKGGPSKKKAKFLK